MSTTTPSAPTSPYLLDRSLATLREHAPAWAGRSVAERISDLDGIAARMHEVAPDLVADAVRAKGITSDMAGEEWVAGPLSVLRTIRFLRQTLQSIERRGSVPLRDSAIRERPDGQVAVDVMPADGWDRILYRGWAAEVRMHPAITYGRARRSIGGFYARGDRPDPRVAVVLGAGNVSSIAPLDVVHQLFVENRVVALKFNPVNDYIGPYVEHAFGDLIAAGFVRTAYGGEEVGAHLVMHPEADAVHITGSEESHDAIVFGSGAEGTRRKAENRPVLTKPITSELGNVSPVVVVPGRTWTKREMWFQAGHIATQLLQNAGYNCNAAKILILPEGWPQRDELFDALRRRFESYPGRPAYYPGSLERYRTVVDASESVTTYGESDDGVPATIVEVEADEPHPILEREAFCRVMGVVELPAPDAARFLDVATEFCNERVRGSLNVTLIVDSDTLEDEPAVERAVDRLRYGTVGVNLWAAAGFPLGVTPWGAFPGNDLADIGSGIGFVHNARLIDHPQKTVVRAPFVMFPEPTWSVFHRRAATALRRATTFEATPAWWRLPGLLSAGMRP